MNEPERSEAFVLGEGERKVTYVVDSKMQNTGKFIIRKEDHTIGNMLRMQLLKNRDVIFAGYKVPHPLEHNLVIKVQTTSSITPIRAMQRAIMELNNDLGIVKDRFNEALRVKRQKSALY